MSRVLFLRGVKCHFSVFSHSAFPWRTLRGTEFHPLVSGPHPLDDFQNPPGCSALSRVSGGPCPRPPPAPHGFRPPFDLDTHCLHSSRIPLHARAWGAPLPWAFPASGSHAHPAPHVRRVLPLAFYFPVNLRPPAPFPFRFHAPPRLGDVWLHAAVAVPACTGRAVSDPASPTAGRASRSAGAPDTVAPAASSSPLRGSAP